MSRKAPLARGKYRSVRTPGFPELHVSARLPLGHPVTAHAASPAKDGRWRSVRGFEPRSIVCFSRSLASFLQVKLLLRGITCWPLFFTRR